MDNWTLIDPFNMIAIVGRLAVKKGAAKKTKPAKDPNKPKTPPSAFFVFMEDFRVQYKQKHPNNKLVANVGKAGGEKWKSMSDAEKAPFAEGPTDEPEDESDKSRSEVNDEDDGDDSGEEDEDDD
ncbi:hypothetical protein RND81_03G016500 [Saponaria officinalis]|uniref:HMG box domain-containing protein n=1 Tax=Saponaria officinalis TaxID=3572 RepID=A0AAW1M2J8_SAPOF